MATGKRLDRGDRTAGCHQHRHAVMHACHMLQHFWVRSGCVARAESTESAGLVPLFQTWALFKDVCFSMAAENAKHVSRRQNRKAQRMGHGAQYRSEVRHSQSETADCWSKKLEPPDRALVLRMAERAALRTRPLRC